MSNKFGLFINLDYAHKPTAECSYIWQKIMDQMLHNGFSFQRRSFTITTDKNRDDLAHFVRGLLDELQAEQQNFYGFIIDCYILNLENCSDLTLPDTSDSIDVEDITLQDLNTIGIDYELLFKRKDSD